MNRKQLAVLILSLVLPAGAAPALAAPGVTIAPSADNVYVVQATGFSKVAGVDMVIRYDTTALSNPRVTQGSLVGGALMANNISTPGTVRIALVRTIEMNGSGGIATVSFDRVRSTGADIKALTASVLSGTGRSVQASTQILNSPMTPDSGPGTPAAPPSDTPQSGTSAPESPGTRGPSSSANAPAAANGQTTPGGGVFLVPVPSLSDRKTVPPAQTQPESEPLRSEAEKTASTEPVQTAKAEKPASPGPVPAAEKQKVMAYQSILEKFRQYKGKKTPQALTSLFAAGSAAVVQDPGLVLTDGKATLKLVIELDSKGENNNFLLEGLTLVSLKNSQKNEWIAELLPDARIWEASIVVPRNNQLHVMPLAVAPPMDVNIDRSSAKLDENDFKLFLKERGTPKAPRFDLNNDGKRDHIDEYIFTANYIAQQKGKDVLKPSK